MYPSISALSNKSQDRKIRHHVLNQFGQWVPGAVQPHGKVKLNVQPSQSAQSQLHLPPITTSTTTIQALADSRAQMCVADWSVAKRLGLTKADLLHPALTVSVADNSNLELVGAHFMSIYADSGESTEQLVYFATNVGDFYLSKAAMIDLGIIPKDFPKVGCTRDYSVNAIDVQHDAQQVHEVQGLHSVRQRQVAPTPQPSCSSSASSPGVPPGITSLGFRPPPSAQEGETLLQRSLVTKPGDREHSVRVALPPAGTMYMDAPEIQQKLNPAPSPFSLPTTQHPGNNHFMQVQQPQGAVQRLGNSHNNLSQPQGYDKIQSQVSVAAVQQQQQVSCKDIGPDWEEESYNSNKVSSGSNLYEVTGGFPSVQLQSNPSQDAIIRQITWIKKCVETS